MANDPVCLMEVDLRDAAAMTVNEGRAYYFCSEQCKQKFTSDPTVYINKVTAERLTIGVMGSADTSLNESLGLRAMELGSTIARRGLILITGACLGLPYDCARGARKTKGMSVGISPALSLDEHIHHYKSPTDAYDVMIYTGSGLMGREVTNIRSSDIVIIIGGRSGTLGEFAIAYDEGKLIGVLEGTGGITDEIPQLVELFDKGTGAVLIYESVPEQLIEKLLAEYTQSHFHHPSCFCEREPIIETE